MKLYLMVGCYRKNCVFCEDSPLKALHKKRSLDAGIAPAASNNTDYAARLWLYSNYVSSVHVQIFLRQLQQGLLVKGSGFFNLFAGIIQGLTKQGE